MRLPEKGEIARGYLSGWFDRRTGRLRGARVFCYHGVVERKVDSHVERNQHLLSTFESHVQYLARHFRILGMPGLLDEMAPSAKPKKPAAVITFDDATASSLVAAEVLSRGKIPWFLFVPAGEVGLDRAMWTVDLSLLMLYGERDRLEVRDRQWPLTNRIERENAFQFLRFMLKSLPASERKATMDAIRDQFPAGESARLVGKFPSCGMLGWDEITQLGASGVEIGSHGLHHEIHHDRQPEEMRRTELVESRALIEASTGRPCHTFAFPNGNFVSTSGREVQKAGYSLAFTTRPGTIGPASNPFLLPRLSAVGSLSGFVRSCWWADIVPTTPPIVPTAAAAGAAAASGAAPAAIQPPVVSQRAFYN